MEMNKEIPALEKEKNTFFTISRIVKRKNIKNVIKAFYLLKKEGVNFVYYIAGKGNETEEIKKTIVELNLSDQIFFLGKVSEDKKDELYNKSSYFLLPSVYDKDDGSVEGYGIVFIEANSYGLPVLSGDTGGMVEAVNEYKTGLYTDGSVNDIYIKIKELLTIDFNKSEIKKHANEHNYLRQQKFIAFINSKLVLK
jgi:phosphatidylinositol alpha-1,6-mannosyltransferase